MRTLRTLLFGALSTLSVAACLDPLFEDDSDPDAPRYVVCCQGFEVTTCECTEAACGEDYRTCPTPKACVPKPVTGAAPSCPPWSGGDAGTHIPLDAGVADGGTTFDGGVPADAGPPDEGFGACCVGGRVSTCPCLDSACSQPPFLPCASGTCVEGVTSGACPR